MLLDEVDKYPPRSGGGGRLTRSLWQGSGTNTFAYNKKIFITSTPTLKAGAIWKEWESCTQQLYFYVPCPHCGKFQRLRFTQIKFIKEGTKTERAESAYYECPYCQGQLFDADKHKMLKQGRWMNEEEIEGKSKAPKRPDFRSMPSIRPWLSFRDVAYKWLDAQGDQEKMQNFVNSWLGEPWEDVGSTAGAQKILDNRGIYTRGIVRTGHRLSPLGWMCSKPACITRWMPGGRARKSTISTTAASREQTLMLCLISLTKPTTTRRGKDWYIDLTLVDSGDQTDLVYDFCYVHNTFTIPVKGASHPIPSPVSGIDHPKRGQHGAGTQTCHL